MFQNEQFQASGGMIGNMDMTGGFAELNVMNVPMSPVTSLCFDRQTELTWVGNQIGTFTSYISSGLERYTSVNPGHGKSVRDIFTYDDCVVALYDDEIRCHLKRGLDNYVIRDSQLHNMRTMTMLANGSLLIGGDFPGVVQVDIATGEKTVRTHAGPGDLETVKFRSSPNSKWICCGTKNGQVLLRDPKTLRVEHTIQAHTRSISDFDVNGSILITCGCSDRHGKLCVDQYVNVFDLRNMRRCNPLQCVIQPHFLRFMSSYTRRLAVFSNSGQFVSFEDNASVTSTTPIYQVNTGNEPITCVDVSETAEAIAFADTGNNVHLWSTSNNPSFNKNSKPIQYPTSPAHQMHKMGHPRLNFDDFSQALSRIPFSPQPGVPLFSTWNPDMCRPHYRPVQPIQPSILQEMKVKGGIGHAPNNGSRLLNQAPYAMMDTRSSGGHYESGRGGNQHGSRYHQGGRKTNNHNHNGFASGFDNKADSSEVVIPNHYERISFKYTKWGEEENDIVEQQNRTYFSGLDPNLQNAYSNCMLQVLYFIEPLRIHLLSHHNINKEFDIAEELGCLFHMMDSSKGGILQATNFLRAFRTIHEANALGLTESYLEAANDANGGSSKDLSKLIQSWNRFILQQLHTETKPLEGSKEEAEAAAAAAIQRTVVRRPNSPSRKGSIIDQLFGTEMEVVTSFNTTGNQTVTKSVSYTFDLIYPSFGKDVSSDQIPDYSFSQIIRDSIQLNKQSKTWDARSSEFLPMTQQKTPKSLPEMLVLNCNLNNNEDAKNFWTIQNLRHQSHVRQMMNNKDSDPLCERWNELEAKYSANNKYYKGPMPKPSWIPYYISLLIDSKQKLHVSSPIDHKDKRSKTNDDDIDEDTLFANYELHASVVQIKDDKSGGGLVSCINVSEPFHQRKEKVTHSQWYVFNNFTIISIDKEESCDFDMRWKVPCILYYKREDLLERNKSQMIFPISSDIMKPVPSKAKGRCRRPDSNPTTATIPLQPDELADNKGIIVAIDCEFVVNNAEEAELHSDGTRSTIKPTQMLPARVTVVRGEGKLEEIPLIDDYIPTQDHVVDYLTKYSGIKPGDLDVALSSKHLSEFKLTYCKLRYLIHRGCTFVGHGLKKDFKVLNICVPQEQVKDTVMIYHIKRKRFISLRFLAWYFLGQKIQEDMHDSVEDAVTALKLYKHYLKMTSTPNDRFDFNHLILQKLYDEGRKREWKVPHDPDEVPDNYPTSSNPSAAAATVAISN